MWSDIELCTHEIQELIQVSQRSFAKQKVEIDKVARLIARKHRLQLVHRHVLQRLDR